jgi:hypothetical protein
MAKEKWEPKLDIPIIDGKPEFPRYVRCECGHEMRHRPGNLYGCPDCKRTFLVEVEDGDPGRCNPEEREQVVCPLGEEEQERPEKEPRV